MITTSTMLKEVIGTKRKKRRLTPKEAKEMVKEMKPKFPSGVTKTSINEMIQSGELALNYEKNTYEYTTQSIY